MSRRLPLVLVLSAALVVAPVAGGSSLATAATDTAAPLLVGVTDVSPASVDLTTGTGRTTVSVRLTDDASGVDTATVTLTGTDGSATEVPLDLASGDRRDGTWSGPADFSGLDPLGAWRPTSLVATDVAGNTATITSGLGAGPTLVRTADTTAPVLGAVTAEAASVDTTTGDADLAVTVRATDDLSGVASGRVTFTSPDGQDTAEGTLDTAPVLGGPTDGTWSVDVTFPARSTPGRWTLTHVALDDGQWNESNYDVSNDDGRLPSLVTVLVRTDADTTAPVLTGFGVGPATASTAYAWGGYVYAQVGFTDTGSGLASAVVTLRRPNGTLEDVEPGLALWSDADARSGTSTAGTLTVPVYTDLGVTGTWTVASVVLTDLAGNVTTLATAALGARASIRVTSTAADTQPPALTGLAFSPTALDTRTDPQDGVLLVGLTDPDAVPAGFDSGSFTLTSPSGLQTVDGSLSAWDLASGDQASGTFRGRFSLDRRAEDGDWRITSLTLTDAAHHARTYTGAAVATPTLGVLGGATPAPLPPSAPGPVRASLTTAGGTSATVSWGVPASSGGAAVTAYVITPWLDGVAQPATRAAGTAGSATVAGLLRGRSYTFTVAAENVIGRGADSAASTAVLVPAVVPGAPLIGTAGVAASTATVTWTPPAADGGSAVTGYVVTPYSAGTAFAPTRVGVVTSAVVPDLAKGRTFTFRVAAVNAVGTGPASLASPSVSVAATVPDAPARPSAVAAGTTATVRWSAPADTGGAPITAYDVTGSPGGSCHTTATSCVITGLAAGSAYSFTVTATNPVGEGSASPATAEVVAAAPVPTALTAASSTASVVFGHTVVITGRLTRPDTGAGVAGQSVRLQYRRVGGTGAPGAWTSGGTVRSASDGSVRFADLRPAWSAQVRLVAEPGAAWVASTSRTLTVTVHRGLTLGARDASVARGERVTLTGRVSPASGGVTVRLQRWTGRSWATIASLRSAGTAYAFGVRAATRGRFSYRVLAAGEDGYATSASPHRTVRVT